MKNIRGDSLNVIKATLPRHLSSLEVYPCGDWHTGDKACDLQLIEKTIATIHDKENAYCILNGDLLNNATKTSVSDSYAEKVPPMEQLNLILTLLTPIKDKILAIEDGNHERRTYRQDGIDLSRIIARELGIEDRYSQEGNLIFLRFGEFPSGRKESNGSGKYRQPCYTIYASHGSGGGRKEGSKVVRLADMASIVDADIYIHGHTHLPLVMKQSFFRTDIQNSSVKPVTKLFVNTSSTLDYAGYSETGEFKPNSKDSPIIHLSGTRKFMTATL
jgi:predicted phosphodiesterase